MSKRKALIVDDEEDICFLLSTILRQKDIQSEFAGSLAEAAKSLERDTDYSLIFLDNHLPDGFGIAYIDQIKKKFPSAHLIIITAHVTTAERELAEMSGAELFISKPFSKETILKTIDNFFN